jgi:hypothetical protein
LVLGALGFVLGWRLGKVAVGLVLILARAFFAHFPAIEYLLFPYDFYAVIRPWWAVPVATLVLGVGVHHMSTPLARKLVGVFALGLYLSCVQRLWITATFDPETVTGVVRNGICKQTTHYTCGAAAAAMLLDSHGVQVTEREMAEVCWTNGFTGTDSFCVARGLRNKLAGTKRVVNVVELDWEELVARKEPSVVTIHFSTFIDHWVIVRSASEERVEVGDPLAGNTSYSKGKFLAKWTGLTVTADRVR